LRQPVHDSSVSVKHAFSLALIERGKVSGVVFKKCLMARPCSWSISDDVVNAADAARSNSFAAVSNPAALASAIASLSKGV
jgi:hypothetical protein